MKTILEIQSDEAQAAAAHASHDETKAIALATAAVRVENGISGTSQPPYPIFPPNEMLGKLYISIKRPADAESAFRAELARTPGRPVALSGIAEAAVMQGEERVAKTNFKALLTIWSAADPGIFRLGRGPSLSSQASV